MGGWILEVAKMFMYISFPVGMFYYVNQPAYYEKWIIKAKEKYFLPENKEAIDQLENFIREFNTSIEKKRLDDMEKQHRNKQ